MLSAMIVSFLIYIATIVTITGAYGISEVIQLGLDACNVERFCNGNISIPISSAACCSPCSCDSSCVVYKNCCPDADLDLASIPEHPYLQYSSCEPNEFGSSSDVKLDSFLLYFTMVTECPDGLSCKKASRNASLSEWMSSVIVSDRKTGTIFINKQCALCHRVNDVVEWAVEVQDCTRSSKEIIELIKDNREYVQSLVKDCVVTMIPTAEFQITSERFICKSEFWTGCNGSSLWDVYDDNLKNACEAGVFEIMTTISRIKLRNPFCFLCNTPTNLIKVYSLKFCQTSDQHKTIFAKYSNLFRIVYSDTGNVNDIDPRCGVSEIFDTKQETCRTLYCSPFTRPSQGICKKLPILIHNYRYIIVFKFTSSERITSLFASRYMSDRNYFTNFVFHLIHIKLDCIRQANELLYDDEDTAESGVYVLLEVVSALPSCYLPQIKTYIQAMADVKTNIANTSFSVEFVEYPTLQNDSLLFHYQNNYQIHKSRIEAIHNVLIREVLSVTDRSVSIYLTDINMIRVNSQYFCPYFVMNQSQICNMPFIKDCNVTDATFNGHFYKVPEITENGDVRFLYRICIEKYYALFNKNGPISPNAEGLVSLIVSSMSLTCIVVTVAKMLYKETMDSSSKRLFVASVCNLFVAQAIFQFASGWTKIDWLCRISGIILHYSWLATVFAFNAYCILIDQTLRSFPNALPKATLLIGLFLYTYVLPAVFIIINVIQSRKVNYHDIGYGISNNICNVNSSLMRALLFALPIFLSVGYNLFVFIRIGIAIRSAASKTKSLTPGPQYAVIYFRLLMFTGLAWFLGFINEFLQSDILSFTFTIAIGGQGIGFCLAFVFDLTKALRRRKLSKLFDSGKIHTETGRSQ